MNGIGNVSSSGSWWKYLLFGVKTGGVIGCGEDDGGEEPSSEPTTTPTASINDEFNYYNTTVWEKSDGWANGSPFNNGWRADHVTFENGNMILTLNNDGCPEECSSEPYVSGEYRTRGFYGYGRYEASIMSPPQQAGAVTAFFIYTGPTFGEEWNEIDIVEILLINTNQIQTNYYKDGVGGHEAIINLGFDTSADFHSYAIEWLPDSISWYVDGNLIRSVDGSYGTLPSTEGKIYFNLWPGDATVVDWLGEFNYTEPLKAKFDWVKHTPYNP